MSVALTLMSALLSQWRLLQGSTVGHKAEESEHGVPTLTGISTAQPLT